MHHEMSLRPGPLGKIADGTKRYELRLHDEKRRLISVGDTITFTCTADDCRVHTRVTSLHPFGSFAELYRSMPLAECGYTPETAASADPRDMEKYYPPEKQHESGVLAIGVERIRLPLASLSAGFTVRELTDGDVTAMLRVAQGNPLYYRYMGCRPTAENLRETLTALPPGRTPADKHFFGWFDGERLVGMMDLIWHHPTDDMAFIGWLILASDEQGKGLGRRLVSEVLTMLKAHGVSEVRLGRIDGNPQSEHFWRICSFEDTAQGYDTDGYHVCVMTRKL